LKQGPTLTIGGWRVSLSEGRSKETRTQITAAENFGANGWMLWNPHNIYNEVGLRSASSGSIPYGDRDAEMLLEGGSANGHVILRMFYERPIAFTEVMRSPVTGVPNQR